MKMIIKLEEYIKEYVDMNIAKKVLPKMKFKHSKRIAELSKLIKDDENIYSASLYHDFIERGGNIDDLKKILNSYSIELVKCLTNEDDSDTLEKLKKFLKNKPQNFIDDVLIIKLCDRTDNLKKRVFQNTLTKPYRKKSVELIQWILDNFKGDKQKMKQFIESNIFPYIPKIEKKIRFN